MSTRAKWYLCAALAALFVFSVIAQEQKPAAPEAKKEAVAQKAPEIPADVALELRTAQLRLSNLVIDYQRTAQSLAQVRAAVEKQQGKVLALQGAALRKSGLDPEKYEFNPDTLEVKAKPEAKEKPKQ